MDYERLMRKCLSLAKKGRGKVSPNPMVGCVVLDKSGNIISTGYHHKYGDNHAERDALLKLKNGEEKGGVLVVNLEPCSHYGKTPPCADLIIERGIKKVIIGCKDNNPKVNGGGIKKLKNAGIEIVVGVLEDECRALNEVFFTDHEQHRTFVALKTAVTIDGKIATVNGDSKWITSEKSRNYARKLRGDYDAILTSSRTVIVDNPEMKHKLKIVLDRELKTDFNSNIYKQGRIIVVTSKENVKSQEDNIDIVRCPLCDGYFDLKELLKILYDKGIKSVFVECGGKLAGSFIKSGLVDKLYTFVAPKILNDNSGRSCFDGDEIGKISDSKEFVLSSVKKLGEDLLVIFVRK